MNGSRLYRVFSTVVAVVMASVAGVGSASHLRHEAWLPAKHRLSLANKAEAAAGVLPPAPLGGGVRGPFGRDISWPNCPRGMGIPQRRTLGNPMPPPNSAFVVIGLTNGPAFYPNPCLDEQVAYARQLHLWTAAYAVVTYPSPAQLSRYGGAGPAAGTHLRQRLENAGWAQARVNVDNMRAAGLASPVVWVDVEPVTAPAPWSTNKAANRAVLAGAINAYRAAGLQVGVYSTTYLWQSIVGTVSYGLPEWRSAGATSIRRARSMCTSGSIEGGPAVIAQWYSADVDYDLLCPGPSALRVLRRFFIPL
jgi:hypothetical protein